jgi:hypothetical protein
MSLAVEQLEPGVLATARYGKDKVRVFRVVRDPESKVHNVVEYNVTVLVEGAIETRSAHIPIFLRRSKSRRRARRVLKYVWCLVVSFSYTQGDNSVVVATDSSASLLHAAVPFPSIHQLINVRRQYSEEHY